MRVELDLFGWSGIGAAVEMNFTLNNVNQIQGKISYELALSSDVAERAFPAGGAL